MKVRKKRSSKTDSTDIALMVESATQEEILVYDENKIVTALVKELDCPEELAKKVSKIVTEKLQKIEQATLTTSLIRAFVNVVLYENGFNKELKSNSDITISMHDITQIIENSNNENGNTTHNPESINLTIAERVLKEYALRNIFSKEISKAHLEGKIHVHDIGMPTRYYCSGHSPEYIKKYGLKNIPTIPSASKPSNSAETLARHICSITQYYTSLFAGAIGYEGLNIFFAPLIRGYKYKEVKQLAQTLIFDLSQLAGAKGGQVAFTDFNVYIDTPEHYKNVLAMGERGQYLVEDTLHDIHYFPTQELAKQFAQENDFKVLTYGDFEKESKIFLKAIIEVSKEGDALGLTFAFPKINLHVNENTFKTKKSRDTLMLACKAISKKGSIYVIFDRNAFSVSQCCRLKIDFSEDDMKLVNTPEELRFVGIQNVSINLPNIPLQVNKNEDEFYNELEYRMELATQAHIIRRDYVWGLTQLKNSPLSFYTKGMDGKPYIRLENASYLIGIVGLNECVYNLIGQELHDSDEAFEKGIEIITFMNMNTKKLSSKYNIHIKLEESPAESTAGRFAKLDVKKYGDIAFVKRNKEGIYYTNSIHFAADSNVDYITRIQEQSKFHTLVEAGSMIHVWANDFEPDPKAIYQLIENTWYKTDCVQLTRSIEQTACKDCSKTYDGFYDVCPECGSKNLIEQTRITGYYVHKEKFNPGKKAELEDRKREVINYDNNLYKS